ncbi:MAG: 5-oxoprolinase subunit PxpA [Selenomonadales bacterium]|nr:5-oxoprolinase subunit PxpA [Selenomonadales bacterium]
MSCVDLNCDLGESFGAYTMGMDAEVIPKVTSVNVACGYHAGDPLIMEKTVALAKQHGAAIGAHPGFPDLMGFGRRQMVVTPEEAGAYVKYQVGALMAFAKGHGLRLQHVKPHGALYNMAAKDEKLAEGICKAIYSIDPELIFMGLAGSVMLEAAERIGLKTASEVFADRAYNDDGSLVARSKPGAVIHDPEAAVARAVKMAKEGKVISINGKEIDIRADSICVHGDNPKAIETVIKLRNALIEQCVEVKSLR